MRKIKFRLWDGQRMRAVRSLDWKGEQVNAEAVDSDNWLKETGYQVIMQFTGLLDSKGLEIYEGDIISFESPKVEPETEVRHGRVWYCMEGAVFVYGESGDSWEYGGQLGDITNWGINVIGNIYEDPEFVEGSL